MSTSSPSNSRRFFSLLLVILAAGGGVWGYRARLNAHDVSYQTIPVTRGDLIQAVTATGTINPVINVQVGSQISGIISKLFADYNSPVKAGQIIAQFDPATYKAVVMQAEGALASAKAELELDQINLKRNKELRARNAVPQATLDQSLATLHQSEAAVKTKDGALAQARVDLERCTIYSPIDGIVISRSVDVGQTVAASLSAPVIFTIANNLAKMQIDANVAEADVGNVEVGQQQRVAIARALINDPEVLLADEPTGNLDSRTSIDIMSIFQRLNDEGITVIMVTHEPDIAAYTKRNIVMRDGRIQTDQLVKNRLIGAEEMAKLNAGLVT